MGSVSGKYTVYKIYKFIIIRVCKVEEFIQVLYSMYYGAKNSGTEFISV